MLTIKHKPWRLQGICGQPIVKEALTAILRKPSHAPRVFIFHGPHGTGKTSVAHILARALNCTCKSEGTCPVCQARSTWVPWFQEFDAGITSTKEEVLALRDDLYVDPCGYKYRLVVLDEFHLAGRAAQSALLKTLESAPDHLFIVFCTTDLSGILWTIRSRAVELPFNLVDDEALKEHLVRLVNTEGMTIEDSLLDLIVARARGHVRDAVMMLDVYQVLEDPSTFKAMHQSAQPYISAFLGAVRGDRVEIVKECVEHLSKFSANVVTEDFFLLVTDILQCYALPTGEPGPSKQGLVDPHRSTSMSQRGGVDRMSAPLSDQNPKVETDRGRGPMDTDNSSVSIPETLGLEQRIPGQAMAQTTHYADDEQTSQRTGRGACGSILDDAGRLQTSRDDPEQMADAMVKGPMDIDPCSVAIPDFQKGVSREVCTVDPLALCRAESVTGESSTESEVTEGEVGGDSYSAISSSSLVPESGKFRNNSNVNLNITTTGNTNQFRPVVLGHSPRDLARLYDKDSVRLMAFCSADWAVNAMGDTKKLSGFLWALYASFRQNRPAPEFAGRWRKVGA